MKNFFSLAAAAALSAASLSAQAQITLDGVVNANEIGNAGSGLYTSLGAFTTPHISNGGFGNWGLLRLYAANTNSKLYFFVAGTMENTGNGFQLYMDFPHLTRVAQGTALPAITGTTASAPTMFEVKGSDPGVAGVKMDMPVDAAIALKGDAAAYVPQALIFTSPTAGSAATLSPTIPVTGAATTIAATATTGAFAPFAGMRMAYRNSSSGSLVTGFPTTGPGGPGNPGNTATNPGSAGSYGWEIEMDRTALGLPSGANVIRLFAGYVANGGYWSSDVIPEIPGNGNTNLENTPDFTQEDGTQAATFNVVVTSNRKAEEASVAVGVFPNPSADLTTITYRVQDGTQPVNVELTDLMGRKVRTLYTGTQGVGFHNLPVNKLTVAAGTYMVKVQVGDKTATRKVVLL